MNRISRALLAVVCLHGAAAWAAETPGVAFLVVVNPADTVLLGQAGYCGEMQAYDRGARSGMPLPGGRKTWVRMREPRCGGDLSFTPVAGRTYLLRKLGCAVDLHLVNPGADPTPAAMDIEPRRSCLLPWSHGGAEPQAAASSP